MQQKSENTIIANIIGYKIKKIEYREVNHHFREFYYDGFDCFDFSINIQMENDIWWHLAWKDEEYFEFGEGHYPTNKHIVLDKIKTWDATERWIHVSNQPIIDFKIMYIDSTGYIPSRVKLTFSNKKSTSILIAEELDLGKKTITNIEFKMSGVIFVIHNEKILR